MIRLTRKEDISLYLYLKDRVIGPQFSEVYYDMGLSQIEAGVWEMEVDSEWVCPVRRGDNTGLGRGLIYFDHVDETCVFGVEQTSMVNLHNGSVTASGYTVDYIRGNVITTQDLSNYLADYAWNYVSVVDAWPDEIVPPLPVVSIELITSSNRPLQLGYGDIRECFWNVQVFANDKGERDDLIDVLYDGIYQKRCSLYNFDSGLPITQNAGTYNTAFNTDTITSYPHLFFESVKKRLSGLPSWGFYESEIINRYRAEITFETRAYKS